MQNSLRRLKIKMVPKNPHAYGGGQKILITSDNKEYLAQKFLTFIFLH
jgi:hypothetical protein